MHRRAGLAALVALLFAVPAAAQEYVLPAAHRLTLGRGAWSYFGDARAIAHGRWVFTGWISPRGDVWVAQVDTRTLEVRRRMIYPHLGVDDHNNPSLVWFHGRLAAFFCEHSGRVLGRDAKLRYRIARRPFSILGGFGKTRALGTNTPGGLGCTYPNPVRSGRDLFVFWRGGDWNPTFSITRDGRHWTKARTLVRGPGTRKRPQRPYAKYAEGPGDSWGVTFSDGHPTEWPNSLYFLQYRKGVFLRADGTPIGTLADVPFSRSEVDRVYRYSDAGGSAWPHDIAFGEDGNPVITYTRRVAYLDDFHYARWTGSEWADETLIGAGGKNHTFTSGGITLMHDHPQNVLLSRNVGAFNQVELWTRPTPGTGSWVHYLLTGSAHGFSIRPVFPRDFDTTRRVAVLYFEGTARSYLRFNTKVKMLIYRPLPR